MRNNDARKSASRTFFYSSAQAAVGLLFGSLAVFLVGDWGINHDARINNANDLKDLQEWQKEHMKAFRLIDARIRKLESSNSAIRVMSGMSE